MNQDSQKVQEEVPSYLTLRVLLAVLTTLLLWNFASSITNEAYIFANVSGSSMDYSLLNGQHVMIDTREEVILERGNIIAFNANKEDPLNPRIAKATANDEEISYVKRIIAIPGDTIEGRNDGIYLNGEKLEEPYLANRYRPIIVPWNMSSIEESSLWADETGHTVVPEDHVFVLGDNREVSEDSRYFGYVHKNSISGNIKPLPWNKQPTIEKEAE